MLSYYFICGRVARSLCDLLFKLFTAKKYAGSWITDIRCINIGWYTWYTQIHNVNILTLRICNQRSPKRKTRPFIWSRGYQNGYIRFWLSLKKKWYFPCKIRKTVFEHITNLVKKGAYDDENEYNIFDGKKDFRYFSLSCFFFRKKHFPRKSKESLPVIWLFSVFDKE